MTKNFSILSIVVVLLFSVCLVGCNDNSSIDEQNSIKTTEELLLGKWKLNAMKSKDDKETYISSGSNLSSDSKLIFKQEDGVCYLNDELYYYKVEKEVLYLTRKKENLSNPEECNRLSIEKLTEHELDLVENAYKMHFIKI